MSDTEMRYVLDNSGYIGDSECVRRVHAVFALLTDDEYHSFPASEYLVAALSGYSLEKVRLATASLIKDGSLEITPPPYESDADVEYRLLDPQVTDDEAYPSPDREAQILRRYRALTRRQANDVVIALVIAGLLLWRGELEAGEAAMIDARHTLDLAELTTLESITERGPQDLLTEFWKLAEIKHVLLRHANDWESVSQSTCQRGHNPQIREG